MDDITVHHHCDDEFAVLVRDNLVYVDQPIEAGGGDAGPTPIELFVASLAACMGFYVRRYLARHGLPDEGLEVGVTYTMNHRPPARVAGIELRIQPPANLPEHRREALIAVARHCMVLNSITHPPQILIDIETAAEAA